MEGTDSCKNKLYFTDCLELDFKNNMPTSELRILKELSLDINNTLKKHNGSILKSFEFGENNYLIFISTMIIRMVETNERMILVDISDIPSFIKNFLNNSNSQFNCLS